MFSSKRTSLRCQILYLVKLQWCIEAACLALRAGVPKKTHIFRGNNKQGQNQTFALSYLWENAESYIIQDHVF